MSNILSITQLEKIGEISNNSKILTFKEDNNCYTLDVKELLILAAPHNFTSNTGNSITIRCISDSITFSTCGTSLKTSNILKYKNNKILTGEYSAMSSSYTFTFDPDDDIKELQIFGIDDIDKLFILNGELYGLDISSCKSLNYILFNPGTINAKLIDISWNNSKIEGLNQDEVQSEMEWTCEHLITNENSQINILNRIKAEE